VASVAAQRIGQQIALGAQFDGPRAGAPGRLARETAEDLTRPRFAVGFGALVDDERSDAVTQLVQVDAERADNARCLTARLVEQGKRDVRTGDEVVVERHRLAQRHLEHVLGVRGERDVPRLWPGSFRRVDVGPRGVERYAGCGEHVSCGVATVQHTQQQMLCADVIMAERPRLFLRVNDDAASAVGESLEDGDQLPLDASVAGARPKWIRRRF
jgi:hypothetical protein